MPATLHHNTVLHPISNPNICTTTTAMDGAIEDLKSCGRGDEYGFKKMA
jgi:hypothetical protein